MRWSPTDFLALTLILTSCILHVSCAPVHAASRSPSPPPFHPPHSPSPPPSRPGTPPPGAFNGAHHFNLDNLNIHTNQPPGPGYTHHSTHISAQIGPSVGLGGQHPHGHGASGFSLYSASFDANHKWKKDGQSSSSGSSSSPGSGQGYFNSAHHFQANNVDIRNHHYVQGQGGPLPPRGPSQLPWNTPLPPAPDHRHYYANLPAVSDSPPRAGSPPIAMPVTHPLQHSPWSHPQHEPSRLPPTFPLPPAPGQQYVSLPPMSQPHPYDPHPHNRPPPHSPYWGPPVPEHSRLPPNYPLPPPPGQQYVNLPVIPAPYPYNGPPQQ